MQLDVRYRCVGLGGLGLGKWKLTSILLSVLCEVRRDGSNNGGDGEKVQDFMDML